MIIISREYRSEKSFVNDIQPEYPRKTDDYGSLILFKIHVIILSSKVLFACWICFSSYKSKYLSLYTHGYSR